jgi:hypothetical protein
MCNYSHGSWCERDKCDVPNLGSRRCVLSGINVCEWITTVRPTAGDLQTIADMPRVAADANG